jgi:hypothetical protein
VFTITSLFRKGCKTSQRLKTKTKTRNILQKQLSTQVALLPQTKLQTIHHYKLSKKAEKTSQRLITTKIINKTAGTNKLSTQAALLSQYKLQNNHHIKPIALLPKKSHNSTLQTNPTRLSKNTCRQIP